MSASHKTAPRDRGRYRLPGTEFLRQRARVFLPWLILLAGALVTVTVANIERLQESRQARLTFDHEAGLVEYGLRDRLKLYDQLLRAGRGMLSHPHRMSMDMWRRFTASIELAANYPGISGFGVVTRVEGRERAAFEAAQRLDNPGFAIQPEGERGDYLVYAQVEPFSENHDAVGFDAGSNPDLRKILEQARDSGQPGLSSRIGLAGAPGGDHGFALCLAYYQGGTVPADRAGRRRDLAGWVLASFDLSGFMDDVAKRHPVIDIELFDGAASESAEPIFDSDHSHETQGGSMRAGLFDHASILTVGGRTWTLLLRSTPEFEREADGDRGPLVMLGAGAAISGLLAWLVAVLIRRRERAHELAVTMTAALHETEARYRNLVQAQPDLVVRMDLSGRFTFVNDATCARLGQPREALVGSVWQGFVHPEDRAAGVEALQRVLGGSDHRATVECRVLTAAGVRWYECELFAIFDAGGAVREIQGTGHDVTARRTLEADLQAACERAETASRVKSRFLVTMSHELRTPLNSVIGFSELLQDMKCCEVAHSHCCDYTQHIRQAGYHLRDIINDVIDISKIDAGKMACVPVPLPVVQICRSAARHLLEQAAASEVTVDVQVPAGIADIWADEWAVNKILFNLLSNAIKFTPAGGTVSLQARATAEGIDLIVTDTGIGIPAEQIDQILEPFEQIDTRYARARGGTGLGLALVRGLVGLSCGRLSVESTVGVGSRFTVHLPAASIS